VSTARPASFRRNNRDRIMVTPEGIALPFTLASRGSRFGALMLDLLFIVFLQAGTTIALIAIAGGQAAFEDAENRGEAVKNAIEFLSVIWIVAMFLFRNAYFLFFELGARGATLGKRIVGIRVAARDGGRLTAEMVIARNLLRDIELFLPIVFIASASDEGDMGAAGLAAAAWFLIFALFPCFNKDRLRAGDIIAGSWVVETPKRKLEAVLSTAASTGTKPDARGLQYRFGDAELTIYGEYELQTLERVLRENRPESIRQVYEAICTKIGWTIGDGDERAFLDSFYTQLRARLETGMRMGKRKADKFTVDG
jgi:uncharacterized RDD family membrane protein YckC